MKELDYLRNLDIFKIKLGLKNIKKLSNYNKLSKELVLETIANTLEKSTLRSPFQSLWAITKAIAEVQSKNQYKLIWRSILFNTLGYVGFFDPSGTGLLNGDTKRQPTALILSRKIKVIDIVPIQKHRRDERRRVINNVDRHVKKVASARNRIAKRRFKDRNKIKASTALIPLVMGAINALSL